MYIYNGSVVTMVYCYGFRVIMVVCFYYGLFMIPLPVRMRQRVHLLFCLFGILFHIINCPLSSHSGVQLFHPQTSSLHCHTRM